MSDRVVEMHYSVAEVALLLRFTPQWVRERAKAGAFGRCFDIDGDIRVPASGVNEFLESHPLGAPPGVKARNEGELRRKLCPDV